ncbi:MaoC family dehydratase N-terminal domain-containing protein [Nocardia sp. BSTN01]|uniref:FAS1-like dehydratase domain-containing protein n=1 Tax=Nocardia sp. BSTN01 TaxID=2783665 RepID=UPI00188E489A|nr:MaoC family dehydratase N-terminal domain-containing protein [Nocardia sp. BSTN01]MBF4997360.1 MaoC family dehydratase N-terminal domain-containing protein [Nocardia sp. BSTN01]
MSTGDGRNSAGPAVSPDEWTSQVATTEEVVDPAAVRAVAALFDDGLATPAPGDPLPPMWHWAALSDWTASGRIAADGHPVRGGFLPPIDLPRRMFAGGEVVLHAPLTVGETIRRESVVDSVVEKKGRTGTLVVVTVSTRIFGAAGRLAVAERQNLIYRAAGASSSRPAVQPAAELLPIGPPLHRVDDWTWEFATDPTLLMRFSAATSNAHRIHYDWPYATHVEGYPGLVVHGPLMTMALAETLRLQGISGRIATLRHRNLKPLFCAEPAMLRRTHAEGDLLTVGLFGRGESDPCVSLEVELAPASTERSRSL